MSVITLSPKVFIKEKNITSVLFSTLTLDSSIDYINNKVVNIPAGTTVNVSDGGGITLTPKYFFIYNQGNYELEVLLYGTNFVGNRKVPLPSKSILALPDTDWYDEDINVTNPSGEDCLVTVGLYGIRT